MIASMTAFAREQCESPWGPIGIEVKTVNHRYLDLNFKLPDVLRSIEGKWRETARNSLTRGKVDVLVRIQSAAIDNSAICVDEARIQQVVAAAEAVTKQLQVAAPIDPLEILRWPGVILDQADGTSEKKLFDTVNLAFQACLSSISECRQREGAVLVQLLQDRLSSIEEIVSTCRESLPELLRQQESRLLTRLENLRGELDQDRIEQEVVLLSNKADVAEELDRLSAHTEEVRRILAQGRACGRRLDFLMQELNREANTLSSKAIALASTRDAVELKVLIEQMREQIQNIE